MAETAESVREAIAASKLVDLDWRFGITGATSETPVGAKESTTYLQLRLVLENSAGKREQKYVEMTLIQLFDLLASLETAKTKVVSLS